MTPKISNLIQSFTISACQGMRLQNLWTVGLIFTKSLEFQVISCPEPNVSPALLRSRCQIWVECPTTPTGSPSSSSTSTSTEIGDRYVVIKIASVFMLHTCIPGQSTMYSIVFHFSLSLDYHSGNIIQDKSSSSRHCSDVHAAWIGPEKSPEQVHPGY